MSREFAPFPTGDAAERFLRQWQRGERDARQVPSSVESSQQQARRLTEQVDQIGQFLMRHRDDYHQVVPGAIDSLTVWGAVGRDGPRLSVNSFAANGITGLGTGRVFVDYHLSFDRQWLPRQLGVETSDRLHIELHTDDSTMDQARALTLLDPAASWTFGTSYFFDRTGMARKVVTLPAVFEDLRPALAQHPQTGARLVESDIRDDDYRLTATAVAVILGKLGLGAQPKPSSS